MCVFLYVNSSRHLENSIADKVCRSSALFRNGSNILSQHTNKLDRARLGLSILVSAKVNQPNYFVNMIKPMPINSSVALEVDKYTDAISIEQSIEHVQDTNS